MSLLPENLKASLQDVQSMGVVTGAGISAESGIPTYRGKGGVYDDPEEGDRTIEALSGQTLRSDPDRTWLALAKIANAAAGAEPNTGHVALIDIEASLQRFVLLTQNVDGLHRRAGSKNLIEIHGNASAMTCTACGLGAEVGDMAALVTAPRCASCNGIMRPDVVLFGEMLNVGRVERVQQEFYADVPDCVLAVGTSAMFAYILEPLYFARQQGKLTIEVNPERTELSDVVEYHLQLPATKALPAIAEILSAS
ncbi:MAG: SIR2 family NAD-dependent protein deacylase [Planctomycetota bacterium]|jgi:NAD-dependent deacetylase